MCMKNFAGRERKKQIFLNVMGKRTALVYGICRAGKTTLLMSMSKAPPKQVIDEECSEVNQNKEKDGVTAVSTKREEAAQNHAAP